MSTLLQSHSAELDRLTLRAAVSPGARVDAAAGKIRGVSLITGDREASGHGVWIDSRTIETFHALLSGRRLKAYATHGAWTKDGTLDEIGYWEAAAVAGKQLLADFVALDAWKSHNRPEYDTLFELAEKLPTEFGVSLSFKFTTVWVSGGGMETGTRRKFSGGEIVYDPPAPAGAMRKLPSVRAIAVYSADFVDDPAANKGLFRSAPGHVGDDGGKSPIIALAAREARIAQLNAERAALGNDEASAIRRGKISAEIRKLRSGEAVANREPVETEIQKLEAERCGLGIDEASARRRGHICARLRSLRAQLG